MMKYQMDSTNPGTFPRIAALPMRYSQKGQTELLLISSGRHGWSVPGTLHVEGGSLERRDLAPLEIRKDGAVHTPERHAPPSGSPFDITGAQGGARSEKGVKRLLSRLVFEQAGAIGSVDAEPIGSFLDMRYSKEGSLQPQRFQLYPFTVRGTLVSWKQRGQRTRRWISAAELVNWVSDPGLSLLIRNWLSRSAAASKGPEAAPRDIRQWADTVP